MEVKVSPDRLASLFDLHHLRFYRLARRISGDPEEARDLVQTAFLRAARRPGPPPTQERIEAEIKRLDRAPASLNFRLTLLLAGNDFQTYPKLPPQEKRALADIKQFFPYKWSAPPS